MEMRISFKPMYSSPWVTDKIYTTDQLFEVLEKCGLTNELIGRYSDEDILRELEIRGVPEDILKPFKDDLAKPVVTRETLEKWLASCRPESQPAETD